MGFIMGKGERGTGQIVKTQKDTNSFLFITRPARVRRRRRNGSVWYAICKSRRESQYVACAAERGTGQIRETLHSQKHGRNIEDEDEHDDEYDSQT